ncbi:hypothetical protein HUJ05_001023 [Dendroctonus ponderosae]|nr:hypothetical protein HUJ05_001023 [Dendroctonus ponderosae]
MKSKQLIMYMFVLTITVLFVQGSPQRYPSMTISEAQNNLIGNTKPAQQDCVCMNWRRCADINSEVHRSQAIETSKFEYRRILFEYAMDILANAALKLSRTDLGTWGGGKFPCQSFMFPSRPSDNMLFVQCRLNDPNLILNRISKDELFIAFISVKE